MQIIMEKDMVEGINTTILIMDKRDTRDSKDTTLKGAIIRETKGITIEPIKRDITKVLEELLKGTNKVVSIMGVNITETKDRSMQNMVTKGNIKRDMQPKDFTIHITRYCYCLILVKF